MQMLGRLNSDPSGQSLHLAILGDWFGHPLQALQDMCVCVYAKTRDLILLRSCYADAGETEVASINTSSSSRSVCIDFVPGDWFGLNKHQACLLASNRFIPVCVYAKTRDLIVLRSCYADAGETELASINTSSSSRHVCKDVCIPKHAIWSC